MQSKRYIICGNPSFQIPAGFEDDALRFHLHGVDDEFKITLSIADIHRSMYKDVPVRYHDLLEIATYVYCADQAWQRGQRDADDFGGNWRRQFHFVIPVDDVAFWNSPEVRSCLAEVLGFLSDDHYEFDFVDAPNRPVLQQFLSLNEKGELLGFPEQVMMFSGGLDSLGGAVEEIVNSKRRVVLVNHRSSTKLDKIYRRLAAKLDAKAPQCPKPYHVRVTVHKKKWMNKDYTQRGRSFLYVCIGATIAKMLGLGSVRFYENGVISMNLPIAAQVVGGKATRTTHPRVIHGFRKLLSLVAHEPVTVETPFIWKTKAEVVELIARAGCQDMIGDSISCTHTWEISSAYPHCGTCSQCVDRRFAVLAADVGEHDPIDMYLADVFTDVRTNKAGESHDEDRLLYAGYVERANQVANVKSVVDFLVRFPEAARVIKYLEGQPDAVAQRIFDMYKRHSNEVARVIDAMIAHHATALRQRTLPANALLRIVYESHLPVSTSAIAGGAQEVPENAFRRAGDHWEYRFGDHRSFRLVTANVGARYINHMLAHPHESTPVVELVVGATLDPFDPMLGDSGDVADDQAVREYRREAQELFDELERAREMGSGERVEGLHEELAKIEAAISEARGLGGRSRKAQSGRERIRKAFQAAVRRAREKIAEGDPEFAEHLKKCIRCGTDPIYRPDSNTKWETRPAIAD
jgi:hypothetical protein